MPTRTPAAEDFNSWSGGHLLQLLAVLTDRDFDAVVEALDGFNYIAVVGEEFADFHASKR